MREILFRGKSVNGTGWVEGSLLVTTIEPADATPTKHYHIEDMTIGLFPNDFQSGVSETVAPDTVGQFTDLTDKNGNKIFEGDVVTFETTAYSFKPCVVAWSFTKMRFIVRGREANYPMDIDFKYEVIGNIHDNPELLGGADNG